MNAQDDPTTTRQRVVLVHGLWLNGFEFFLLRDRLARAGFAPETLHYSSMHASLAEATDALASQLRAGGAPAHVVAHSLGGVVALEAFARHADLPPGRVVLLGSPVQGSCAARGLARFAWGSPVLGPLAVAELCRPCERRWQGGRELGVIAGSLSVGLGRLFADLPEPNDGTVAVEETRLPGAADHCVLEVSHTGMLLSSAVADATIDFLRHGSFRKA